MLAAARHCCLCNRYKGMKLEVHHIQPESKGGSNHFDNAIVLCFDCHADAGAYNPDHPRGTRITPEELRRARDKWYGIVKDGNIEARAEINVFHCRYIIGKSFEMLREIVSSDLQHFPIPATLLVNAPSLNFLREVIRTHPQDYRRDEVWGDVFDTQEDYLRARADSELRPTVHHEGFEYFTFERVPSLDELRTRVASEDGVTRLLLDAGISNQRIARALAYDEGCGEGFPEIYRTRPLWGAFLAITNVSQEYLTLIAIEGEASGGGTADFRPIHSLSAGDAAAIPLPRAPVPPGSTIVVPVSTILGPLDHFAIRHRNSETKEIGRARWQSFDHITSASERTIASYAWGPAFSPHRIKFIYDGFQQYHSVHDLNVDNVYEIDRHWGMGSCPHAFMIDINHEVTYMGEVLARGSGELVQETIQVPCNAVSIVIAELEEEVTFLATIRSGTDVLHPPHLLRQGEFLVIYPSTSELTLEGFYLPLREADQEQMRQPYRRNELVGNFRAALVVGVGSTPAMPP